jgi:glycosyltransferase involved in cell wall biosynthesis
VRICLISMHPRPLSGQISSLVGLTRALRHRGHQVSVVTAFDEANLLALDYRACSTANAGPLLGKLRGVQAILRRWRGVAAAADVVHLNLPSPGFALVGDLAQAILGRPVIVGFEAHLSCPGAVCPQYLGAAPSFYLPYLLANNSLVARLARFRASRYLVASELQAGQLRECGVDGTRIRVIPNFVDRESLTNDRLPSEVPWPDQGPVLTYIGHFNHVKGVDVLVRALPAVLKRCPTAQLVLAWSGLGAWEPVGQAIAATGTSAHVHLVGRVPVGAALRASTVCALPYRLTIGQAAYPDLLLEAMTVGVPLVTSDLPLIRELIRPGEEGELAEPDNPADLADRLLRVLIDERHQRDMVRRQSALVQARYEPDHLAHRYEAVYAEAADCSRLVTAAGPHQ